MMHANHSFIERIRLERNIIGLVNTTPTYSVDKLPEM
jgi:hypothetical protein